LVLIVAVDAVAVAAGGIGAFDDLAAALDDESRGRFRFG
jgi:hypothetical protein